MNPEFETTLAGGNQGSVEWYTPEFIVRALGNFDLDPCSPVVKPYTLADKSYTILDDGLKQEWEGRVFCNPPYGRFTKDWLTKCANHGNAIVLIYARVDTKMFFNDVWPKASGIFFFKGRVRFLDIHGNSSHPGAPSCLIAYGNLNAQVLEECELEGQYLKLNI